MKILTLLICFSIEGIIGARVRRLTGGEPINIEEVPYQVSIRANGYHVCGGSLISTRHILTAAHCVADLFDEPYDDLTVITGTDSLKAGGIRSGVAAVRWHNKFENGLDAKWNNDIAVLTLAEDIEENDRQRAIKLPREEPPMNATGIISGFGRTSTENPYPSNCLQGSKTTILPSGICERLIEGNEVRETQICGRQKRGIGICKGDSGGPLAYKGKIVGIASWNIPCGRGVPDFYTNVYRYLDFIEEAMMS